MPRRWITKMKNLTSNILYSFEKGGEKKGGGLGRGAREVSSLIYETGIEGVKEVMSGPRTLCF